jgi:aryl-alcohol dehydrogenase-like predicted oxidoreductase
MVKLVIGVANFKQSYGIDNKKFLQKDNYQTFIKILKKNKINTFDSSFEYKLDPEIAKKFNNRFNVITKIKLPNKNTINFLNKIERNIILELKKLNLKKFESILFHDINDLKKKKFQMFLNKLKELQKKKLIKYIGVSIYKTSDLNTVFSKFKPDLIQFPLSFMNRSFLQKKIFKRLLKSKAKLQVRSIFLQGLMLKNYNQLKKLNINKQLKIQLLKFIKFCSINDISQLEASVHFIKQFKDIDFITFGINSNSQLITLIKEFNKKKKIPIGYKNFNDRYLDPRKWNYEKN